MQHLGHGVLVKQLCSRITHFVIHDCIKEDIHQDVVLDHMGAEQVRLEVVQEAGEGKRKANLLGR